MSTRSNIAMVNPDGKSATMIYCHWDGYPEHNGRILLEHYTDPQKVKEMIELGDMSVLAPEIGVEHNFDDTYYQSEQCTYYGRDRHEPWDPIKPRKVIPIQEGRWETILQEEHLYLFMNGVWFWSNGDPIQRLTREICKS